MLRTFKTSVVECDGKECESVFADVVPMMPKTIALLARQSGWSVRNGAWLCPNCVPAKECQSCHEPADTLDGSGNCPVCVASMPGVPTDQYGVNVNDL